MGRHLRFLGRVLAALVITFVVLAASIAGSVGLVYLLSGLGA